MKILFMSLLSIFYVFSINSQVFAQINNDKRFTNKGADKKVFEREVMSGKKSKTYTLIQVAKNIVNPGTGTITPVQKSDVVGHNNASAGYRSGNTAKVSDNTVVYTYKVRGEIGEKITDDEIKGENQEAEALCEVFLSMNGVKRASFDLATGTITVIANDNSNLPMEINIDTSSNE